MIKYQELIKQSNTKYASQETQDKLSFLKLYCFNAYLLIKKNSTNHEYFDDACLIIKNYVELTTLSEAIAIQQQTVTALNTMGMAFFYDNLDCYLDLLDESYNKGHQFYFNSSHQYFGDESVVKLDDFVDFTFPDLFNPDGSIKEAKKWSFGEPSKNSNEGDLDFKENFDSVDDMFEDSDDEDNVKKLITISEKLSKNPEFVEASDQITDSYCKFLDIKESSFYVSLDDIDDVIDSIAYSNSSLANTNDAKVFQEKYNLLKNLNYKILCNKESINSLLFNSLDDLLTSLNHLDQFINLYDSLVEKCNSFLTFVQLDSGVAEENKTTRKFQS